MDSTILTDRFIWVYNDCVPPEKCQEIIDKFNASKSPDKKMGRTFEGVDTRIKESLDLNISNQNDWKELDRYFKDLVGHLIKEYVKHIKFSFSPYTSFKTGEVIEYDVPLNDHIYDTGYQIQRTEPGKGYIWHHDFAKERVLTYIIYLNDVREGWTQFYNGDQVAPKTGRCVIFPATWTYYHQGYPPKDTKYLVTGWVHSNFIEDDND